MGWREGECPRWLNGCGCVKAMARFLIGLLITAPENFEFYSHRPLSRYLDQKQCPIAMIGRLGRDPCAATVYWECSWGHFRDFAVPCIEPRTLVFPRQSFDLHLATHRQIDRVHTTRFCQAVGTGIHELIVRFGAPPLELPEEVNDVLISGQEPHRIVPAAVHPAAAGIRP